MLDLGLVEKLEPSNSNDRLPFLKISEIGHFDGPKTVEKLNSEVGSFSGYLRFVSQVLYKLKLGRNSWGNLKDQAFYNLCVLIYVPINTGNVSFVGRNWMDESLYKFLLNF